MRKLIETAGLFLRLGAVAFGGPVAHTAIMHDEIVKKRKWLDDQQFLDLVGATNLIPGPNSTEIASHIGFLRAGWMGLIAAGLCFTIPAVLIVLAISWIYVRFGDIPQTQWLMYGIKPVVIAIIIQALWHLGKKAIKNSLTASTAICVVILYFIGLNEVVLLFAGGLAVMLVKNAHRLTGKNISAAILPFGGVAAISQASVPFSLPLLFFTFLKIGAILYGGGYVLIAFLRTDLVLRLGWLTDQQLIDAIAIGQITPGPLFTTATFIGYILGGIPGALLATAGIFLPSFIFVAIFNPFIPKMRKSIWFASLLDGVNAASVALMAAVSLMLGKNSLTDTVGIAIAIVSFVLLVRFKVNSAWLVIGGAITGVIISIFG